MRLEHISIVFVLLATNVFAANTAITIENKVVMLAEMPHWPVGMTLPDHLKGRKSSKNADKADVLIWIPESIKNIHVILLIPNNTDSKIFGEHTALRRVAVKHKMAIVYLRSFNTGIEHRKEAPAEPGRILEVLDLVAKTTNFAEFRHAPWITFGKSSRGEFPFRMGWLYPERTIASISYHAETPTWPILEWANLKDESILHVNANGQTEWGGTWFVHVRPSLLNYRAQTGWLPHIAVAKGVGHGNYHDVHGSEGWGKPVPSGSTSCLKIWDYLSVFIDKAVSLRVPEGIYPFEGPIILKQVNEDNGYLIDPFAVEELFRMPRQRLRKGSDGYLVGDDAEIEISGYAELSPVKDFIPEDDMPVVKPDTAVMGFKDWIYTTVNFPMKNDPMLQLGRLQHLTPKAGDRIRIDRQEAFFKRIESNLVSDNGGIDIKRGLRPAGKFSLLAFTVIKVEKQSHYKLMAPFTPATRQQIVINGVPIRHKQILHFKPGYYPLLMVVRMTIRWDKIGPWFEDVTQDEIALAPKIQIQAQLKDAEDALIRSGKKSLKGLIRKASDVPKTKRNRYFWVADREQAEAWFKLHAVYGQQMEIE